MRDVFSTEVAQIRASVLEKLKSRLSPDRLAHSLRVEKIALALAKHYGVSATKVSFAALLHDYARQYDSPQLLRQARKLGLKIDAYSQAEPKLLHAELSAILVQKEFSLSQDVLAAIRQHTLGAPRMSALAKIIYLADHIEEGRGHPGLNSLRRLAFRDLDQAVGTAATKIIKYLLRKSLPVHPGSLRTRNYYLYKI